MKSLVLAVFLLLVATTPSFAQRTSFTHTTATVGIASASALAASTSTNFVLLINDSDTTIYCKFGAVAVLNQGIRLNANGGSAMFDFKFPGTTQALNCISSGATKILLITRGVQ